jgi:hypothetical protein
MKSKEYNGKVLKVVCVQSESVYSYYFLYQMTRLENDYIFILCQIKIRKLLYCG